MKKALLLLFITPLCAMNNKRTFDKVYNNAVISDEFNDDAVISDEEIISQKISKTNPLEPEEICDTAVKTYASLSKELQDATITNGDVSSLIAKICSALDEEKPHDAALWLSRFEERVNIDYKQLNDEQRQTYGVLSSALMNTVDTMQPAEVKKMRPSERFNRFKNETEPWIKSIVEKDTCGDLTWRTILAPDNKKSVCLSPKTLREKRLEQVARFGTLQVMSKK